MFLLLLLFVVDAADAADVDSVVVDVVTQTEKLRAGRSLLHSLQRSLQRHRQGEW